MATPNSKFRYLLVALNYLLGLEVSGWPEN